MSERLTIALDAMGGDHGPEVVVPAAVNFLRATRDTTLILVGLEEAIRAHLPAGELVERLTIHPASRSWPWMNCPPSPAAEEGFFCCLPVAIDLVKAGKAHACVSAGNTGALMATARCPQALPNIDRGHADRGALHSTGSTHILDLGPMSTAPRNTSSSSPSWAAETVTAVAGIAAPKVRTAQYRRRGDQGRASQGRP